MNPRRRIDFREQWVLVTGASSGLGERIAWELAGRGANLLLTARRAQRLELLARAIEAPFGVRAIPLPLDLGTPDADAPLFEQAISGRRVHAVVLSAARYWFGSFD